MYALLTVLGALLILAMELPGIRRRGRPRELAAFSVLMIVAFGYALLAVLRLPVPNPTPALEAVFKPVSERIGIR